MSGSGKLWWKNKEDSYSGQIENGEVTGVGIMFFNDGSEVEGEWVNGHIHGFGSIMYLNYDDFLKYVGEWKEDERSGRGTLFYKDKSQYTGDFSEDSFSGNGTFIWPDGKKYEGHLDDDQFDGFGTLTFAKSGNELEKYEGEFKEEKRSGHEILLMKSGARFAGQFENEMFHGPGEFFSTDGKIVIGQWENGQYLCKY